ncbi:hypothetical protein [Aquiflexum sp.]|uniref:hypothetical protein n=1 Tax=Aquiflexum sp. TaxID=1872584 RepID=UPI00359373B0
MENKKKDSVAKNRRYRKYLRIGGILVFVLVFLQTVFYFGSDLLLRNYLKERVNQASDNKYEIDFDRFYILLLQRGISFKGLKINPVEDKFIELVDAPYYKISIPDISLTRLNYLFRKKEFVIGNIDLVNPAVDFRLKKGDSFEPSTDESALLILQEEIKKSFLTTRLKEIRIKNINIKEADVLLKNFIAQKAIKADHTSIYLKDIQLLQMRSPETPFNAEGFSFELQNFEILLSDSVHTIQSSEIKVSSIDQYIEAKRVNITPDFSKASATYFQVELEDLLLSDADINKVFYTSEIEVGELKLQKPSFNLFSGIRPERKEIKLETFDLYNLIEGILQSININHLKIEEGKFTQRATSDPDNYRIKAERIDFNMEDFYVGPNESKKTNQFFYANQASVELFQVDLALGDSLHWIQGEYVRLSSFDDEIKISGFKLFPINENQQPEGKTLLEIEVPELMINNANLKKTYNQGIIDINEIVINNPNILLRDVQGGKNQEGAFDLKKISRDYLEGIYVNRLVIKEGSLVVDNNIRIRQDSLSFGKVSVVLENFALDQETEESDSKGIFWADHLQLELEDYALKLADNLHVFKADRVFIDTKNGQIRINGFALQPFNKSQIQTSVDRYGVSTTLDIFVPQFQATGVDVRKAYFDGILKVQQIRIPSPKINLYRYRPKVGDDSEKMDSGEMLNLLTNYFSEVQVDSLIIQRATLNYENLFGDRTRTFSEDNVSVAVKNFHIYEGINPDAINSLFSDEVDLSLNNYIFNIAGGKYNILADRINFNTAKEEIITRNVRLTPSVGFSDKTRITAVIPSLSFRGVDLEAFLFDNTLNLEMVNLTGSAVEILVNNDWRDTEAQSTRRRARDRTLPKNIEIVMIDTIEASNAQFSLSFRDKGIQRDLINTGINLSVFDFLLDSAKIAKGEIAGFFGGMSLGIDEFWLTLNDSIHQVTFSKVELDTRYEGILVNNFRIIPKNLSGKPGVPVFSGHIPTALIKTNSLAELQTSKDLWIKELRLFRPDLEFFIDQEKPVNVRKEEKSTEKGILESLRIDEFEIVEGDFAIFDKNSSKAPQEFKSINFGLEKLQFDLIDLSRLNRKELLKKDFQLTLPNYEILLKDSLNKVKIGLISLTNNEIKLTNVEFIPRYGRYQYSRMVGMQTDVANIHIPVIIIDGADLDGFLENETIVAKSIRISDIKADLFRDKRFPKKQDVFKAMPQELMKKAGVQLSLDSLFIENATINYLEFPENGMVPGNISFSNMNVAFYPFHLTKENEPFPVEEIFLLANAKLNGQADLNLQGQLFFEKPFPMKISAQMGEFDLEYLNSILQSNAFLRVTEGKINGADWSFTADEKEAVGRMILLYSDLKLELLDERTLERGTGRTAILTFVLNTFAVRSNNPRRYLRKPISSNIYELRDTERFIFNYLWSTTLSGLKGSLGLGQPKVPKRRKMEAEEVRRRKKEKK